MIHQGHDQQHVPEERGEGRPEPPQAEQEDQPVPQVARGRGRPRRSPRIPRLPQEEPIVRRHSLSIRRGRPREIARETVRAARQARVDEREDEFVDRRTRVVRNPRPGQREPNPEAAPERETRRQPREVQMRRRSEWHRDEGEPYLPGEMPQATTSNSYLDRQAVIWRIKRYHHDVRVDITRALQHAPDLEANVYGYENGFYRQSTEGPSYPEEAFNVLVPPFRFDHRMMTACKAAADCAAKFAARTRFMYTDCSCKSCYH